MTVISFGSKIGVIDAWQLEPGKVNIVVTKNNKEVHLKLTPRQAKRLANSLLSVACCWDDQVSNVVGKTIAVSPQRKNGVSPFRGMP